MRTLMIANSAFALALVLAACSDEDRPNDIPRTVPPLTDGATATLPAKVQGVGPAIEAAASMVRSG